jgi:hypothetical protein
MTIEKQRHYLHGDRDEHTATFYCSACDIFFAAEHLGEPHSRGRIDAGAVRFVRELKNFERRGQWHEDRFSRPGDAVNVFHTSGSFDIGGLGGHNPPKNQGIIST